MTTDLIENRELEKAGMSADAAFFYHVFGRDPQRGSGRAQDDAMAAGGNEAARLAALLEQKTLENDGHERCMSATVALLKYAHMMIERAEDTIRAQESRISKLEALATTDDLTGLRNRRGFFDIFMQELDRCERGLSRGGLLVLIDLDNFKAINDTAGHMAGDACLRLVARTLENEIRTMDVAARLGGDEFVILLSNTCKEEAAGRAQALAWQLNHLSLAWYGEEIPVRASLGLRAYKAGDEPGRIFNDADIALYGNKRGRQETAMNA